MRIDKFLWCVRLSKTRSEASQLCQSGKVMIDQEAAKSSKTIYEGAEVSIKQLPTWRTFKVLQIPTSRVGAKLVAGILLEITSAEDLAAINQWNSIQKENAKLGVKGRPTKKDRRTIDDFRD